MSLRPSGYQFTPYGVGKTGLWITLWRPQSHWPLRPASDEKFRP